MRCAICYRSYNLKNVKNTHGRMLILVKLQAKALNLTLLHGCFSRFLNCANGIKSRNVSNIIRLSFHIRGTPNSISSLDM